MKNSSGPSPQRGYTTKAQTQGMGWGPGGAWELERVFCQFTIDVGLSQSYNTTFCWSWDQSESFQLLAVLAENCGWFKTTLVFQDDHRPTEEQRIPSNSSTSHIPSCYRTFFDPFSRSCVPIHRVANPSTACQHSCAPHPLAIWWKNISKICPSPISRRDTWRSVIQQERTFNWYWVADQARPGGVWWW